MAKLREILLKKESSHSSITVYADKAKIHWVINQLVDNAIKFTPPGGEIIIRMIKDNARVTVAVVDTGIGIQSDQLEEIFEPFHQLDGSSTRKQGGTGIGLTLVKKIVEAHNSRIEVTSTPSHGSIFSFILNVVESSE